MTKIADYDISIKPTTFDFACTAVMASTLGYEEIRFVVDKPMTEWKYNHLIGWRRFANICIPMCPLADLRFSVGLATGSEVLGYSTGEVETLYKKLGKIHKLHSVAPFKETNYVTVTMRKSFRNRWRDSDRPSWERVIKWLEKKGEKVVVVEECEFQPITLEYRMAIYANAKMNLSVGNGPMVLCWLSDAPYLSFQLPKREGREKEYDTLVKQWTQMGFPVGSQLSFRGPRQEIVWGPDDFETITTYYEKHMSGNAT